VALVEDEQEYMWAREKASRERELAGIGAPNGRAGR
jgi:hypothetical protein